MGGKTKFAISSILAILIAAALVACGGSDGTTATGTGVGKGATSAEATGDGTRSDGGEETAPSGDGKEGSKGSQEGGDGAASDGGESSGGGGGGEGNGGGSSTGKSGKKKPAGPVEKAGKKESDKILDFGSPASASESEAAHSVLVTYSRAVDRSDWSTACGTFSKEVLKTLEELIAGNSDVKGKGCVAAFSYAGKEGVIPNLGTSVDAPFDSFKVEGNKGWALYGGNVFAMPMTKEGGSWKLNSFEPKKLT